MPNVTCLAAAKRHPKRLTRSPGRGFIDRSAHQRGLRGTFSGKTHMSRGGPTSSGQPQPKPTHNTALLVCVDLARAVRMTAEEYNRVINAMAALVTASWPSHPTLKD